MRDEFERLRDILEAIDGIQRYAARGREVFESDELIQSWMVHHLQIIGEAARSVSERVRSLAPHIPWSRIVGMRHVLVHGYFGVDLEAVWDAVVQDVPVLRSAVEELLAQCQSRANDPGDAAR